MSVFGLLAWEYRLFDKILDRIDELLRRESDDGVQLDGMLLMLFSELEKHEQIENALFSDEVTGLGDDERQVLAAFGRQHEAIHRLRQAAFSRRCEESRRPDADTRVLAGNLVRLLRSLFDLEETRLWPAYYHRISRSLNHSAEHRAWKIVRELEQDICHREYVTEKFLGRPPGIA